MKAVGVTPDYARDLIAAGLRNLGEDELTQARAVGLRGSYVRAMTAAGIRASFDQWIELWTIGVRPDLVQRLRRAGYSTSDPDKLAELQAVGGDLDRYRSPPPSPPKPPRAPPRNWDPITNPDGDADNN